ncbi:hypothetical protein IB234_01985 [Pseudomonas sp. PDM16]|uniref:hypothetical protein n=1 Tax=Pseudomonas sp. PDM16 TaxID=2769292 RepID=UPI00177BB114|nr:hypothetical protein [Pseudomonas sp. PDM16]MBD9413315.1 hypothetical protein [Pseudomonas sp. PDM16]
MKNWKKVLLGTVMVLGAGAWAWWQDEPLGPVARAWLEESVATADSKAYYQLLGLDAPAGQHPQEAGRQMVEAHLQWRAQHGPYDLMVSATDGERLELPGKNLCALGDAGCLERLRQDSAGLAALLARHGELLRRYDSLLALDDYRTLAQPSVDEPLANYSSLGRANLLRAAQAMALAEDGRGGEALALLQQDVRHLRGWLARADNLILKMMLVNLLGRDLNAVAALYRAGLVPLPAAESPLSEAERSLGAAMRREFVLVGSGMLTLVDNPQSAGVAQWRLRLMYKPHMTVNDILPGYQRMATNSLLDTSAFVRTLGTPARSQPSFWRRTRNPVGTILGSVAVPDFNNYLARLHDLEAKLTLFNALGQGVPEADNPYRPGERAEWDETLQAYCFSGPLVDKHHLRCLPWTAPAAQ